MIKKKQRGCRRHEQRSDFFEMKKIKIDGLQVGAKFQQVRKIEVADKEGKKTGSIRLPKTSLIAYWSSGFVQLPSMKNR